LIGFTPPLRPVSSFVGFVSAPLGLLARPLAPVLMVLRGHSGSIEGFFPPGSALLRTPHAMIMAQSVCYICGDFWH